MTPLACLLLLCLANVAFVLLRVRAAQGGKP